MGGSDIAVGSSAHAKAVNAVLAALNVSNMTDAVALSKQALKAGVTDPLLLNVAAFALEQEGRVEEALNYLQRALRIAPNDVLILTAIGRCLTMQALDAQALTIFDQALVISPAHAPAHHGKGLALTTLGQAQAGRQSQLTAAKLDPAFPDPLGALAELAMSEDDRDQARAYAERALALSAGEPRGSLVMARLEMLAGDCAAAQVRLRDLLQTPLAPLHRAAAEHLMAEQLDRLNRPEEAFEAYTRANDLFWNTYRPQFDQSGEETGVPLCRRLQAVFASEPSSRWAPAIEAQDEADPVFLVGFVRSGTTLLEQVLASHPDVVALEERPTLRALTHPFFSDNAGLERLASLEPAEAEALRASYWEKVRSFGIQPQGKVFVDKAPLSVLWLPMIAKLFPRAKILLARRDPRDVVVSCFRHRFKISGLTCAFSDLRWAAEFYGEVMALTELYREKLPVNVYVHRHEELVTDFDAEVTRICDFLEIAWAPAMRAFSDTAKRRDVRTPSAEQVRRGLFSEGMGRWRRYGDKVAVMLPVLAPWVERFGYDPD